SPPDPRRGASESNSSKKTIQGADARARVNNARTARSDSPTYLSNSSGPFTEMKFAADSDAMARARSVLPQPGGPNMSTPAGTLSPKAANNSGRRRGATMAISNSLRTSDKAPTSSQEIFGTVAKPSRK